jgi:hypothetical protein
MDTRWPHGRLRDEELSASPAITRVLLLGFLVAGGLGLLTGVVWVGWHLLSAWLAG